MKNLLTIFISLFCLFSAIRADAQDPKAIMSQAFEKANTITKGYYKMTKRMKYMTEPDTVTRSSECYFKKLPEDKIFGLGFYQPFMDSTGNIVRMAFYTGNELVYTNDSDSSGVITSRQEWAQELNNIKHNYTFYAPITKPDKFSIPHSFKPSKNYNVKLLDSERVNEEECFHVWIQDFEKTSKKDPIQKLREEYHYWISSKDFLVKKYSRAIDLLMNNDTMAQYEEYTLENFQADALPSGQVPGFESIPPYIKLKDYTPYVREPLLPAATSAPLWKFPSLEGDSIALEELKGTMVLIDFFYKGCYPCMQALPVLQALHEKYSDKGLMIVGIDPYDKDAEELKEFLSKRGVGYTVVLSDKELPKQYKVSGYPTLYLLDQNGTIMESQIGYGPGTEKKFEKLIAENLE